MFVIDEDLKAEYEGLADGVEALVDLIHVTGSMAANSLEQFDKDANNAPEYLQRMGYCAAVDVLYRWAKHTGFFEEVGVTH